MAMTAEQLAEQKKQAEEILFSGPQQVSFAQGLFFGHFNSSLVFPYPQLKPGEREEIQAAAAELRKYCDSHIDAAAIDRYAEIPAEVVAGLGRLGVLGMTAPKEFGGRGFSQLGYTKLMEIIGGHCAGTAVFVNAHHSIGIRALVLYGTEEQKKRWLPGLVSGKELAAFALTEPEAGSDAANVQTIATPTEDGAAYVLNGEKRYITNGAIAQVLTVMARTPVPGSKETKVSAFLVTPDLPGFEVLEARMPKCGIRGTATARLAFRNMRVPASNVLGTLGKGLQAALTVLNFGRVTFGASCVGVAKVCLEASIKHATRRTQFKQKIGEFELVKKKIAYAAAYAFAMEATTAQCAAFIDSGAGDYKLETALLKVWSTEALWQIVYDTLQIHGGQGYFSNEPYERMMRDARINQIGEGANDVLRAFIAVVGMKDIGERLQGMLKSPIKQSGSIFKFLGGQVSSRMGFGSPDLPVQSQSLASEAKELASRVREFGVAIIDMLGKHQEGILERQYVQERLADAACELYASSCSISRLDHLLTHGNGSHQEHDIQAGRYYLKIANRKIKQCLSALKDNDDAATTLTADALLRR